MAKNTHSILHLLIVIGIAFAIRAEVVTDSIIQREFDFVTNICIPRRFEITGDTMTFPVELGTTLACISGFQFRLNNTSDSRLHSGRDR